ncbi:MAG: cell division septation protein DedD, partial [Bacteroidia bacterium]
KITDLEQEVATLKTVEPSRIDTVVIEKVIVKELRVIKEVPARMPKKIVITPSKPKDVVIEPAKPVATPSATSNSTQFYVIAGSFANSTAANSYISTLKSKGHPAYQKYDAGSGRYYVHIGKFSTKPDAVNLIQDKKGSGLPLWVKTM